MAVWPPVSRCSRFAVSVPAVPPPRMTTCWIMIPASACPAPSGHGQRSPGAAANGPIQPGSRPPPAGSSGRLEVHADQGGQVGQPAGVTPLVVVPAEYLHQAAVRLGQAGVEHA